MFTGISLHYLLKNLNLEAGAKVYDVVKLGDKVSVIFKNQSITADLNPRSSYLSYSNIKGEGYFSSIFKGKRLNKIEQLDLDRILVISLEQDLKIVFEMFGRRSDCLFLRGNEILNSFKGFKEEKYRFPSTPKGLNLLEASKNELMEAVISEEKIRGLTVGFIKALKIKGIRFVNSFVERKYKPTVFKDILSPFLLPEGQNFSDMHEAIIYYYEKRKEEKRRKELKRIIEARLENKIFKTEEAIKALSEPVDVSIYKRKGDALLTYQNKVDTEKEKVILDYLDNKLEIELDPSLSVHENAQRYFELYKKEKKKAKVAEIRRKKKEKELETLRKKRKKLENAEDLSEFEGFYKEEGEEVEEEISIPQKFRVFTTENGYKVLVGKSAESNHELTFGYARPYDIFLHVKNAPGSHTILRVKDKNKNPPMEDVYEAAYYAAKFSKLKHSKSAPVSYTEKRYVRGGKGLPKGAVILERENVVYVDATSGR